jgi:hypothetical protein
VRVLILERAPGLSNLRTAEKNVCGLLANNTAAGSGDCGRCHLRRTWPMRAGCHVSFFNPCPFQPEPGTEVLASEPAIDLDFPTSWRLAGMNERAAAVASASLLKAGVAGVPRSSGYTEYRRRGTSNSPRCTAAAPSLLPSRNVLQRIRIEVRCAPRRKLNEQPMSQNTLDVGLC